MAQRTEPAATAREDLCRFLAACYYQPDPMFAEERMFDSMRAAAEHVDPALAERVRRLAAAFASQDLEALLVDYTRLFVGPVDPRAQPYGSFWLGDDTKPAQDSTAALLALYREGGFDVDDALCDLPDHVAVELEFLYLLLFARNQALQANDADALRAVDRLQRRFIREHLGAWIGPFAAAVQAGAETPFYRELAALTERVVRGEAAVPTND